MSESAPVLADIWRLPLRSGAAHVNHREQVDYCLSKGIAAIGWGVGDRPSGSLDAVLDGIRDRWPGTGANTVRRFAGAPIGGLVWTLTTDGTYRLGELTGPWRYDGSAEAEKVDCHQVRDVAWAPRALLASEAPGAVIRIFSRRGPSFCRIHDPNARQFSHRLFDRLIGRAESIPPPTRKQVLESLLDPFDVEDLVFVYLQAERDYLVLPASRRTDTAAYEYVLVSRDGSHQAIVQVKTGESAVALDHLGEIAVQTGALAFAYSPRGRYVGGTHPEIERISDQGILTFMDQHPNLLPPRVRTWLNS